VAKFVLKDAYIAINGTAISDHVSSVTIESTFNEVDFTSFGAIYREIGQGIGDATITLSCFQDFAASNIDSIFWPLSQSGGTFGVEVRPTSAIASATNPKYTMTGRLLGFNPIAGAVGDASATDVPIRNGGTAGLVRGTV
jgi:hypothetical protein